ncbi:MAG: BamA/TamA family outer membrane protein [Fusobacterium sp. JB021]|nr:BamA/TamA family outer membrane protein [Fusobacterium sp. JB021]MDP0507442.1 BamA/TamA family outer membrane protein [Fusobacterium sp. JB019]
MRKKFVIVLSFIMMMFAYGADKNIKSQDYKIEKITINNVREIPKITILSKMISKKGNKFSTEKMVKDYKTLKELDYIETVKLYPKYYNEGIRLVVDIKEKKDVKEILRKKGIVPVSDRENINKSVIIKEINFYGNYETPTKKLAKLIPLEIGGYYSNNKLKEGYRKLVESGYFRQITPDIEEVNGGIVIDFYFTENPIIKKVNIIGNTVYKTEEIKELIETKTKTILNYNILRKDREAIIKKYSQDGYVLARVQDMSLNKKSELNIFLKEGLVKDVKFQKMVTKQKGQRREAKDTILKTKDYLIEREIEIEKGKVFNINEYNRTSENLMRLGFIKSVKYEVRDVVNSIDSKEIVLLVEEDRTARIQGAISYGSELGLMGTLSLEENNWKGKGQRASLSYEKSDENYSSFSINFSDPWIKDTDRISWGWSIYKNDYENGDSEAFNEIDTYGISANVGKGLTKNVRINLGTKFEMVETSPSKEFGIASDGSHIKYYDDKYNLYSIYPSISYDTRNSYFNPTKGEFYKWQVELGYASGEESSYFTNTTLEARKYHRGFTKNNIFAYRAVFGIQSDDTKESQRYWVGGSSTLRGYDGGEFRGTRKFTVNLENRTQFNDVLGGVIFIDAGRAWDYKGIDQGYKRDAQMPDKIAYTAGVGLRVNTPMGPLRFDFGWPIGDDEASGMQFYFNMGQSF